MQLLHIERLEVAGPVTVLFGTVRNEPICVGQSVTLAAGDGRRERVTLVAIMPEGAGAKEFDAGSPGQPVKVLIKRTGSTFELAVGMTLEKA